MQLDSATFDEILLAVKARLQSLIANCGDSNCWICLSADDPNSVPAHPGGFGYAIAPYTGTFSDAAFVGGGGNVAMVDAGFAVAVWSSVRLDQPGRDTAFLTDQSRGVMGKASEVLAALCGGDGWRPARKAASEGYLTRDCVFPVSISFLKSEKSIGGVLLNFRLSFDWRLEAPVGQ